MPFDPVRAPAAPPLVGSAAAAFGGAAVLAVSSRSSGVEGDPAALQLAVALQTVGIVALLVAAAFCACHWQVSRGAGSAHLCAGLVVLALGVAPLGGLVGSVVPGPSGAVQDEAVGLVVTAVAIRLCLLALREHEGPGRSVRSLALRTGTTVAAGVVVLVLVDRAVVTSAGSVDLGVLQAGLDLGAGVLWLALAARLVHRRAVSPWVPRGAAAAAALAVVRALDAAAGDAEGDAVHLAATMLGACLAALVCWCSLIALAGAVSHSRGAAEAVARRLDEATDKVLARDAWREELRHDAVNAIAGLRTALSLVSSEGDRLDAPTTRRLLDAALDETSHLEHLVTRSGQDRSVVLDVVEVVGSVVTTRRTGGQLIDLETDRIGGPDRTGRALAIGCTGDLVAVMANLLHNARTHAPGSRVRVRVSQGAGRVYVSVSDDGPGVDEALRRRVLDRGSRGPDSAGTGLGLYVARQLMRAQGGDLEVLPSEEGFHVEAVLPAASTPELLSGGGGHGNGPSYEVPSTRARPSVRV